VEMILKKLQTDNNEFEGVFSPNQTAMMKRVLQQVCKDCNILPDDMDSRESLALVILRATHSETNEAELLALGRQVASRY
jgi:hypothetical protein